MSILEITDTLTTNSSTTTTSGAYLATLRLATPTDTFDLVTMDLYRDIHKGIRAELFAAVSTAGSTDPADPFARVALADHVASIGALLESHASHEDHVIEPALELHAPALAERIAADHVEFDAAFARVVEQAGTFAAASTDQRRLGHQLYLELSGFTSAYLAHQLVEERQVMPALERAVGVEAVVDMNMAIVSSIPPDEMAASLAFMLPAMQIDDRVELLGGMRAAAPPEAFAGVISLARSVLQPAEFAQLGQRLQLG